MDAAAVELRAADRLVVVAPVDVLGINCDAAERRGVDESLGHPGAVKVCTTDSPSVGADGVQGANRPVDMSTVDGDVTCPDATDEARIDGSAIDVGAANAR